MKESGVATAVSTSNATETSVGISARLRRSAIWRLKLRLQFTGWLQYMPPFVGGTVVLALAGLSALVRLPAALVTTLLVIAAAAYAVGLFDLVTIKAGLRPREHRPPRLDGLDAFDLMRARRSTRAFQAADLTDEDRAALLADAADATRTERLLGSSPVRLEYIAHRLTVWPVVGAREFLVAIAPRAYDRTAVIDVGRSLQRVVTAATRRGISTCWIGPGADQSGVAAALGDRFDPERDHVVCVCAVGYRSRFLPLLVRVMNARMHRRRPLAGLFFTDAAMTAPAPTAEPPFAELGRTYEACEWSPSSYNGQTTRAIVGVDERGVSRVDFVASTRSRFYAPVALGTWLANWETGCEALGSRGHARVLGDPPETAGDYGATWLRD